MKIPTIGDVLEDGSGSRWRVAGVQLGEGVEADKPERQTLYLDLDPVKERPEIPAAFREAGG